MENNVESITRALDKVFLAGAPKRREKRIQPQLPRTSDIMEAARVLGMEHNSIRKWLKRGAPHSRVKNPRGGPPKIMVSCQELRLWLVLNLRESDQTGKKLLEINVPIEELTPVLAQIKSQCRWTNAKIAQYLEIPHSTFNGYFYPETYGVHQAPKRILLKAQEILDLGEVDRPRGIAPSREEIIDALQKSKGVKHWAARHLHIDSGNLSRLIDKYDLDAYLKKGPSSRLTLKMIQAALIQSQGKVSSAATLLGTNDKSLRRIISKIPVLRACQKDLYSLDGRNHDRV